MARLPNTTVRSAAFSAICATGWLGFWNSA
jgi:hypothetical protein